jgi:hypothetical protein
LNGRYFLGDPAVDERKILNYILKKLVLIGFNWLWTVVTSGLL